MYTLKLEWDGYRVAVAADGVAALSRTARDDPDLVILDEALPRLQGLEVLMTLRAGGSEVPVVMLSDGYSAPAARRAAALGAARWLVKQDTAPGELSAIVAQSHRRPPAGRPRAPAPEPGRRPVAALVAVAALTAVLLGAGTIATWGRPSSAGQRRPSAAPSAAMTARRLLSATGARYVAELDTGESSLAGGAQRFRAWTLDADGAADGGYLTAYETAKNLVTSGDETDALDAWLADITAAQAAIEDWVQVALAYESGAVDADQLRAADVRAHSYLDAAGRDLAGLGTG